MANQLIGETKNVVETLATVVADVHNVADHHYGAFYENPTFWVAISFVLVLVLLGKPIAKIVHNMLTKRADGILHRITDASRLKDDAKKLLSEMEAKYKNAAQEAEAITKKALNEAKVMQKQTLFDLENQLKNKEKEAQGRIDTSKQKALAEIQEMISKKTVEFVEETIKNKLTDKEQAKLIDNIIAKI